MNTESVIAAQPNRRRMDSPLVRVRSKMLLLWESHKSLAR